MSGASYRSAASRDLFRNRFLDHSDNFDRMYQGEEPEPPPSVWPECVVSVQKNIKTANGLCSGVAALRPYLGALAHQLVPEHYYARQKCIRDPAGEFLTFRCTTRLEES